MNLNEIDIMKLTPEDYLKMCDRCRKLEDEKKQQADYILELRTELERLRVAARDTQKRTEVRESYIQELENALARMGKAAKESAEKIEVLNDSIGQLQRAIDEKDEVIKYWADKAHKAQERIAEMIYKGDSDTEAFVKDAEAKIQSANDRAANAKKEAKAAKERAESASDRVRYLERKLRDVESLNDSLMKELSNRQGRLTEIRDHDADVYQLDVLKYAPSEAMICDQHLTYGVIGLCGEAGEASEIVKKYAFQGHALDSYHLAIELGDVLWYIAYTAHNIGYPLGKIMAMNQEKLAKRYPDGKFDAERSRHREEGDI